MKFSFIIPAYGNYSGLHQLLFDIYKNNPEAHEVIVMDDACPDKTFLDGISWWENNGLLSFRHVRNDENLGFLRNSNKGLKMATGDVLCLVSTDVRIFKNVANFFVPEKTLLSGRIIDWDSGWNKFGKKIYPYLEGWLLTAKASTWKSLGYFDEQYAPNDFEDVDLSTTALSLGYDLSIYPDGYVLHGGAHSIGYNDEREELTKINKRKFQKKWVKS